MYGLYVKMKVPGGTVKGWLTPAGGLNNLKIHAMRVPEAPAAEQFAEQLQADNPRVLSAEPRPL
jgi:hypothetical protein